MADIIPEAIEAYARGHTRALSPLLHELEAETRARFADRAGMLTGPLEAAFLQFLVAAIGARRVLEIGTFTGYSALAMAEALPPDGELVTCDINEDTTAVARSYWARSPHGTKITVRLGPALDTLSGLAPERPFDFVFLDADKEHYPDYYRRLMPLLRTGGLLAADNVLWSGRVLNPERASDRALVAFNELVLGDRAATNVLVTVRDGIMLVRKH